MKIAREPDCGVCGQPRIIVKLTDHEAQLLRAALRYQNSISRGIHARLDALGVKRAAK